MTSTLAPAPAPPDDDVASASSRLAGRDLVVGAIGTGAAVLLVGTAVSSVVQGLAWFGYASAAVALVVLAGLALHRVHPGVVPAAQALGVLVLTCALFSDDTVLGVLPTRAALDDLKVLVGGAAAQIDTGVPPVAPTPEVLFLVTAAFGVLAIGVYAVAILAQAPAAAAVPLLAGFAVPTALADDLLPAWVLTASAAGFLVLLTCRPGIRRRLPGAAAITAVALGLALLAGESTPFIGTAGRFGKNGDLPSRGGVIGLSPFTAVRGQLERTDPVDLFEVRGLPRATYLRAVTLDDYVPDVGWQPTRPDPGVSLPGALPTDAAPGQEAELRISNRAFRDYWLPVYGVPVSVTGVSEGVWSYDPTRNIVYSSRPRQEDDWTQRARFVDPSASQLRAAEGSAGVPSSYLDTEGVDPRIAQIAAEVTAGRRTGFDRAMALLDHFTGPGSAFRYDLRTAPGGGDDALVEFLTVGRVGYCEQFASAMAVMLRTVGVPARVAVGFTAGTDFGDYRKVTTADAHAWVEAWFPGVGWVIFDPTPLTDGRSVVPPYVAQARLETVADEPTPTEPSEPLPESPDGPDPVSELPLPQDNQLDPGVTETAAAPIEDGVPLWPLVVPLVVLAGALTPAALRALQRKRRLAAVAAGGPGAADAAWAELVAESVDRGVATAATETVRGTARRLVREHGLDEPTQEGLRAVVLAVERAWYGGHPVEAGELTEAVQRVRRGIAAGSPLSLRNRLFPPSLWTRVSTRRLRDVVRRRRA